MPGAGAVEGIGFATGGAPRSCGVPRAHAEPPPLNDAEIVPVPVDEGPLNVVTGTTDVVAVDELFVVEDSGVEVDAEAVLLTTVPTATLELTVVTIVRTADDPAGSVAMVSLTEFPAFDRVSAGPALCACETKARLDGRRSASDTVCASLGPLLVRVRL